jgi:hypothetical protein
MSAYTKHTTERLLNLLEELWAEAATWRSEERSHGETGHDDATLQQYRAQAEDLFKPAFEESSQGYVPMVLIVERLLDRLEAFGEFHVDSKPELAAPIR